MSTPRKMSNHWEVKKLGEIFTIERGGSPRPIEDFITTNENGINWIKIGDTKEVAKYITQTKEKIKPEGAKRSRFVCDGDFLAGYPLKYTDSLLVFVNLQVPCKLQHEFAPLVAIGDKTTYLWMSIFFG